MTTKTVTQQLVVDASPATVAKAITSPHGLSTWLSDEARSEKRPEGRLVLTWHDGRQCYGRWTAFEPPERLAWRWCDDVGAPERTVNFGLVPEGDGTRVTASEGDVPDGDAAAMAARWQQILDDLKVFVEKGENARWLRQPMLGIFTDELTPEKAAKAGVPVEQGMLVEGLVPESGAAKAGLAEADVIVGVGDLEVSSWGSLGAALRRHNAGDTVQVRAWRGGEELEIAVTLQGRDRPEIPAGRGALRTDVGKYTAEMVERFETLLEGVSDAGAEFHPAEGEWNVKEVLAHLSLGERFGHDWLARLAADRQPSGYPDGPLTDWQRAVANMPIDSLRGRFLADLKDTETLCLAILEEDQPQWVLYQVGASLHFGRQHTEEHIGQIEETLETARAGG